MEVAPRHTLFTLFILFIRILPSRLVWKQQCNAQKNFVSSGTISRRIWALHLESWEMTRIRNAVRKKQDYVGKIQKLRTPSTPPPSLGIFTFFYRFFCHFISPWIGKNREKYGVGLGQTPPPALGIFPHNPVFFLTTFLKAPHWQLYFLKSYKIVTNGRAVPWAVEFWSIMKMWSFKEKGP